MEFCVKMIPYLLNYIDKIQVAVNSYLCFPTAPEKEGKEKKDKWCGYESKFAFAQYWILQPNPLTYIMNFLPTFPV